ncbi:MAG: response regulator transcription factor [Bacteroidota bacterium]
MSRSDTPTQAPKVLLVDDEDDILALLQYNMGLEGYTTVLARNGVEALEKAATERPNLIILDVMMPKMDGIEVCRRLREDAHLRNTTVMMLTARSEDQDYIEGLGVGADLYLTKPISMPVLVSQVNALFRIADRSTEAPDVLSVHDLRIDRSRYRVTRAEDGETVPFRLPRKEFELLYFLASRPGKVYSRQELLDQVWGQEVYVVDRTVDVHVRKIREKIGAAYIETVKGVGYRFKE